MRRGIVLGVVLGEDEGLPADVQHDFRASGLYHLLAVSGQNVAFLVGRRPRSRLARPVSARLRASSRRCCVIAAYVLAVGWQPSVARAGVAGTLASLAWLTARAARPLVLPRGRSARTARLDARRRSSIRGSSSRSPRWRPSSSRVPRLRARLDGYPLPPSVAEALAVSLACGLATAPIVLLHFGHVPLYTVLANLAGLRRRAARSRVRAAGRARRSRLAGSGSRLAVARRLGGGLAGPRRARRGGSPERAARAHVRRWARAGRGGCWRGSPHPTARGPRRAPATRRARARIRDARRGRRRVGGHAARTGVEPAGRPAGHVPRRRTGRFGASRDASSTRSSSTKGPPEAGVAAQLRGMGVRWLSALVMTHPQRDHVGGAADVIRSLERRRGARARPRRHGAGERRCARSGSVASRPGTRRPHRHELSRRPSACACHVAEGRGSRVGGSQSERRRARRLVRGDRRLPVGRRGVRRDGAFAPATGRDHEGRPPRFRGRRAGRRARRRFARGSRSSRVGGTTTTAIRDRRRSPHSPLLRASPSTARTRTAASSSSPTGDV